MSARSKDVPVRWREDVGWELRCPQCSSRKRACFWPLTEEFWDRQRSLTTCRACLLMRKARLAREAYAKDPEARLNAVRAYRHAHAPVLAFKARFKQQTMTDEQRARRNAMQAAWRRANPERWKAIVARNRAKNAA